MSDNYSFITSKQKTIASFRNYRLRLSLLNFIGSSLVQNRLASTFLFQNWFFENTLKALKKTTFRVKVPHIFSEISHFVQCEIICCVNCEIESWRFLWNEINPHAARRISRPKGISQILKGFISLKKPPILYQS